MLVIKYLRSVLNITKNISQNILDDLTPKLSSSHGGYSVCAKIHYPIGRKVGGGSPPLPPSGL